MSAGQAFHKFRDVDIFPDDDQNYAEHLTLVLTPECILDMEGMARGIQIGQLARETGLTIDAIRFYEKQRLLKRAPRTEGGFRLFNDQDLQHIQFIRRAQELGFSLSEIRELLVLQGEQLEACSHVRDMLTAKLGAVRQKITELRKLESQLAADLRQCERRLLTRHENHESCPVIEAIAKPARGKKK
jgi:DNA-binding transcriptional MerR regulator